LRRRAFAEKVPKGIAANVAMSRLFLIFLRQIAGFALVFFA